MRIAVMILVILTVILAATLLGSLSEYRVLGALGDPLSGYGRLGK